MNRRVASVVVGGVFIALSLWHMGQPVPVAIAYHVTGESAQLWTWLALSVPLAGGVLLAVGRQVPWAGAALMTWVVTGTWLRARLPDLAPCGCLPWGLDQSLVMPGIVGVLLCGLAWFIRGDCFTRRRVALIVTSVVVGGAAGAALSSPTPTMPVQVAFRASGSFGELSIENYGHGRIIIEEVRPLCDCLAVDPVGKTVILPGHAGTYVISLAYRPKDLQARGVLVRWHQDGKWFNAVVSADVSLMQEAEEAR